MVLQSPMHGEAELKQNLNLAKRLSKLFEQKVYLLPCIDSNTEAQKIMREEYMPMGVKENKNPDYFIGGGYGLFDAKNLSGFHGGDRKAQKTCLENHYKEAKAQADNMVFDLPSSFSEDYLEGIINNILKQSSIDRTIVIFLNGKGRIFKK